VATIAAAIARCEQKEEKRYLAELLRIEGEPLHRQCKGNEAEARFASALDIARSQQTLAW